VLKGWREREIQTVKQTYTLIHLLTLLKNSNFPKIVSSNSYKLEMKKSKETFPYILKETPLETHLCKKLHRTKKGIMSSIYGIINGKLPIYEEKKLKGKWKNIKFV